MKKLLITLGIVVALAFSVSAQTEGIGLTGKGIKVGIGMANFTGDDAGDTKMKLGINGGAFITYNFTPMFAFQPEILFQMKGAKVELEGEDDGKYKFNYLTIPMLIKITPQMEGNLKPSFFAGPEVGFLMSAKAAQGDESVDIKDFFKSTDFGLTFGAGLGVQMETMMLTFDARYEMGLVDIPDTGDEDVDVSLKTTNIAVMVGLSF